MIRDAFDFPRMPVLMLALVAALAACWTSSAAPNRVALQPEQDINEHIALHGHGPGVGYRNVVIGDGIPKSALGAIHDAAITYDGTTLTVNFADAMGRAFAETVSVTAGWTPIPCPNACNQHGCTLAACYELRPDTTELYLLGDGTWADFKAAAP